MGVTRHPMVDWRKRVGTNVKLLRQQGGLSQEKLAGDAAIDLSYLGGIERGRRNPSLLVMARLAEALGAELTDLLAE